MFPPGTKLMTVASSVKKSSGPRVGSLGYYIDSSEGHYYPDHKYYAQSCRVAFIRYGFEENPRFEIKKFVAFLPVKDDVTPKNKAFKKWAKRMVEGLPSAPLLEIAMNYSSSSPKSTYYGILAPVSLPPTDMIKVSVPEWKAWMSSILLNAYMSRLINTLSSPHGVKHIRQLYPFDDAWIGTFSALCSDKAFRRVNLDEMYANRKKEMMSVTRGLLAVALRHRYQSIYSEFRRRVGDGNIRFRSGDTSRSSRAVIGVASFLFTPLHTKVTELLNSTGRQDLELLAKNMDLWKHVAEAKANGPACSLPAT